MADSHFERAPHLRVLCLLVLWHSIIGILRCRVSRTLWLFQRLLTLVRFVCFGLGVGLGYLSVQGVSGSIIPPS